MWVDREGWPCSLAAEVLPAPGGIDFHRLLEKYMRHIVDEEGRAYTAGLDDPFVERHAGAVQFSDEGCEYIVRLGRSIDGIEY